MIETRDHVTADKVLHVTLDRETKIIGQVYERPVSEDSGVLKLHWQLIIFDAVQDVHFVVQCDALRPHEATSVDLNLRVSGGNTDGIRGGHDRKVAVLEVMCNQELAVRFLESGETEIALVKGIEVVASKCHGRDV